MKTKNFFFILYSVCSGTKIFPELAKHGYIRALWHLMLLTVLCSIGFALGNISDLKKDITAACSILNSDFGGIVKEKDGIYPKLNRDKEHHVEYQFFQIDYFPNSTDIKDLKVNTELYDSGIIWLPDSAIGWLKLNNEQVFLYPVLVKLTDTGFFVISSKNHIYDYVKQAKNIIDSEHLALRICLQGNVPVVGTFLLKTTDNFESFAPLLLKWSSTIVMLRFLAVALLNMLFYGLIFALFFKFIIKNNYIGYTFKNFFIISVYASFPAIIIGTLLSLAQTQWIDYQTIFIISFGIYLFFILNNLKSNTTKSIPD